MREVERSQQVRVFPLNTSIFVQPVSVRRCLPDVVFRERGQSCDAKYNAERCHSRDGDQHGHFSQET